MRKNNRSAFRNSIRLLGEFYNKARLANGSQLTFMATPLISTLEMLLEDADILDLQIFTSQVIEFNFYFGIKYFFFHYLIHMFTKASA